MTPEQQQADHNRKWSDIEADIDRLPDRVKAFVKIHRPTIERFGRYHPTKFAVDVVADFVFDVKKYLLPLPEERTIGQLTKGSGV